MPGFGKPYDTVEDAAAAALMWLERQPRATQQEYMALLFRDRDTGKFFRGGFKTSGRRDSVTATFEPLGEVAGSVHNHPAPRKGSDVSNRVSQADILGTAELGAPGFLAAMNEGAPAVQGAFDPEQNRHIVRKAQRASSSGRSPVDARTDPFLAQFPIDEFKQALARRILGRAPQEGLRRQQPTLGGSPPLRQAEVRRGR